MGFGFGEVKHITVDSKDHVGAIVAKHGIRVSGTVVEELGNFFGGVDSAFGFGGSEGA